MLHGVDSQNPHGVDDIFKGYMLTPEGVCGNDNILCVAQLLHKVHMALPQVSYDVGKILKVYMLTPEGVCGNDNILHVAQLPGWHGRSTPAQASSGLMMRVLLSLSLATYAAKPFRESNTDALQ